MICDKCNRVLPDDSEFCQYCGNKIETTSNEFTEEVESPVTPQSTFTPVVTKDTSALNIEGMTPEEALNKFLEIQAEETIKMMEANAQSQPHHAGDVDFGLVPEKPIYTLALMSVDGEKEYLNKLYTINGEKITWNRRGSISVDGINGMIDISDSFLPTGQPYKTLFINMYGARESDKAPVGFVIKELQTNKQQLDTFSATRSKKGKKIKHKKNKLISFTNISVIVLSIVSLISIIVAIIVQDDRRNYFENWSPTVVYLVLIALFWIFFGFSIESFKKQRFKLLACLSPLLIIAIFITVAEGSIFNSYFYFNGFLQYYDNRSTVGLLNFIWFICGILILIFSLLPVFVALFKKFRHKYYASVKYREKCYKKVAVMHDYLEKGIISKEDFEKEKNLLLMKIE